MSGERDENTIKGAVIGGVVGGITSYLIHGGLESRDAKVRKETLLNLEKYDVLGRDSLTSEKENDSTQSNTCFTNQSVDGRLASVPCHYVDGPNSLRESKE